MSWNYRLVKRVDGTYAVHEVYYDDDGNANGMTVEPRSLHHHLDEDEEENPAKHFAEELKLMLDGVENKAIFEEPAHWADGDDT